MVDTVDPERTDPDATFVIAVGSVTGKDHYHARQNRQDGLWVESTPLLPSSSPSSGPVPRVLAAIVCDGCGDQGSPCSEVGAALGSRLLAHDLCRLAAAGMPAEEALEAARLDLLAHLGALSAAMGDGENVEDAVRRYFLFTTLGALITEGEALFFSIGDGLIAANDHFVSVGPYPDNTPPYVAYPLIPFHRFQRCPGADRFTIHLRVPTPSLDRFVLGTDGAAPLFDGSLAMLGREVKDEAACATDRWWTEDIYYTNPAALTNRLRLLAADKQTIDWEARRRVTEWGRLQDDATLVLGRRTRRTHGAVRKEASDGDIDGDA